MIDITKEKLISFDEAAAICDVTWKTIDTWSKRPGRRLETIKLGGKRKTSREAIQRFAKQDGMDEQSVSAVLPTGPGSDYASAIQALEERHGSF